MDLNSYYVPLCAIVFIAVATASTAIGFLVGKREVTGRLDEGENRALELYAKLYELERGSAGEERSGLVYDLRLEIEGSRYNLPAQHYEFLVVLTGRLVA